MVYAILDRFMEMMNGHLDSVNKGLEFLVALLARIQCTHIVNALYLEEQTFQSSRSIKS